MELPRPETEFFAEDEFIRCLEVDVPGEVISHDVLANMIRSRLYKFIFIIDSRFPYENKGGHVREINGFLYVFNIIDKNQLIKFYHKFKKKGECIAVVFHCELSSKRGRDVIRLFRNYDREQNQHPHVSFPNIFLLQDGFKAFYKNHQDMCFGDYIPMRHPDHVKNGDLKKCQKYFDSYMLGKPQSLYNHKSRTFWRNENVNSMPDVSTDFTRF